jgi:hypothetical protein
MLVRSRVENNGMKSCKAILKMKNNSVLPLHDDEDSATTKAS